MNNNSSINDLSSDEQPTTNEHNQRLHTGDSKRKHQHILITRGDHKYNDKDNDLSYRDYLNSRIHTPIDSRIDIMVESSSSQPKELDSCVDENSVQSSLASFDLDRIISKYGDNTQLLQLILSSKVEEDRRKAEEARLKQKELEYLVSSKEDETAHYYKKNNKGKEKKDLPLDVLEDQYTPTAAEKIPDINRELYMKRKLRNDEEDEQQPLISLTSQMLNDKEVDYFSPLRSSSLNLSLSTYNGFELPVKRHNSLYHNFSPSSPALSPGTPFSTESTRRLQPLDYLTSRRNPNSCFSQAFNQLSSITRRYSANDHIHPNTLPPLGSSLVSRDQLQNDFHNTIPFTQVQQKSKITSTPFNHSRRLQSLPTLDSFEASIMETLPFDDESEHSGNPGLLEENDQTTRANSINLNDDSKSNLKTVPENSLRYTNNRLTLNIDKRPDAATINPAKYYNSDPNDSKKLPLPPNPTSNTLSTPNSSGRPRRRRKEMQAITMIIETRDFPYNDEYVWKNNGNTIHKNSGQKSIYYKCSNSNTGCPVNKTVTFREKGEYLIKYRGNHLDECSKIKRVSLPT